MDKSLAAVELHYNYPEGIVKLRIHKEQFYSVEQFIEWLVYRIKQDWVEDTDGS